MKIPEILTANYVDADLTSDFLEQFRGSGPQVPSNLPTSCTINGKELKKEEVLDLFEEDSELYVHTDSGKGLRKDSLKRIMKYWIHRDPWEDYDFCVFPRDLSWCLAFTHNDRIILKTKTTGEPVGSHDERKRSS